MPNYKIKKKKITEAEMAKPVCEWLESDGWEVYKEVEVSSHGIADIVAVFEKKTIWVIECKTNYGLTVVDQALRWRFLANYISVCVPVESCYRNESETLKTISEQNGIGILTVRLNNNGYYDDDYFKRNYGFGVDVYEKSEWRKVRANFISKNLVDAQKNSIAGSKAGGHWTPFKNTAQLLVELVKKYPGIKLKTAVDGGEVSEGKKIDGLKHHYSAQGAVVRNITSCIESKFIKGIYLKDGCLFPIEDFIEEKN